MVGRAEERRLGLLEATSIGLGAMIGGGIFILPSIAAEQAGPASMVSFTLAGGISLLAALSHAELATDQPWAGGSYQFVNAALGPLFGSIIGIGMWVGLIFASAFYAIGFAQYLTFLYADLPIVAAAVLLAIGLVGVNYYGASGAGVVQDTIVVTLVVLLAVFIAVGLFNVETGTMMPIAPAGWSGILSATGTIYVALIGFSLIATAAGSVERPARNLPLSMTIAVLLPTLLYVLVMYVSTGIVPSAALAESAIPVADVAGVIFGWIGAMAMVVGAILATISSANASILSAGRVGYSMAQDRVMAGWFGKRHERFGSPHRAILVTGVGLVVLLGTNVGLALLAEIASFLFLIAYALAHVAIIVLRRTEPDYNPSFRIPDRLFPHVPVVGVLAIVFVMTQMEHIVIIGGVGLALLGLGWYVVAVKTGWVTAGSSA